MRIFLFIGIILLFLSLILHFNKKEKISFYTLLSAAFCLFYFSATLFPFLNVWDERFHALVAKNMMDHPLIPTLYNEKLIEADYSTWDRYHIWLHKQPLFMWQIALSFKLFGVNEIALRIPSVVVSMLFVVAAYRSGKILGTERTGFFSGVLIASSPYLMQLISGSIELDQNDVSFIGYISLSIWCWLEYQNSRSKKWLIFIGMFSGFAVLCKWLVGLLVFLIWGVYNVLNYRLDIKKYADLLISVLVCLVTFLPWQIYTLTKFPVESRNALILNSKHLTEAVDGHSGPFYYHFLQAPHIYGLILALVILPSIFIFYKFTIHKKIALAFIISILFVYTFFSFVVTKMPSFTAVLILPVTIMMALLFEKISEFASAKINLKKNTIIPSALILILILLRMNAVSLIKNGTFIENESSVAYANSQKNNKYTFKHLNLPENAVLFNLPGRHYIEAMFYTGKIAYDFVPTPEQMSMLKEKNKIAVVFINQGNEIPDYILKDERVLKINKKVYQFE